MSPDIETPPNVADPAPLFSEAQLGDALNQAADDILDAVEAGDEGLRDALNLMVNAVMEYLTGRASSLAEVVDSNYEADYRTVLSWIES